MELSAFFYFTKIEFLFFKWKKSMLPTNIYGPIKNVSQTHFCKFAFCQTFTVKNSIKRRNKIEAKSTQHNIFYLYATPSGK